MSKNKKDWFECLECGFREYIEIRNYKRRKNKCPQCAKRKRIKEGTERLRQELMDINIILLSEAISNKCHDLVSLRCNNCGKEYHNTVAYNWIIKHTKCDCDEMKKFNTQISTNDFIDKLPEIIKQHFEIVGEYVNRNTKIMIRCKKCKEEQKRWALTLLNSKNGIKCRCMQRSLGEQLIFDFLQEKQISFIEQYTIKNEIRSSYQYFDFFLPQFNVAIEYNGQQHYVMVEHWGGEEKFKIQQELDEYKQQYCNEHNIELIIIKYNETKEQIYKKIETVLERSTTNCKNKCSEMGDNVS